MTRRAACYCVCKPSMNHILSLLPLFYEWTSYLVRFAHLVAGIAWIGNSFYFMWLDSHLEAPEPNRPPHRKSVEGYLWGIHSGGFYQIEKRKIQPEEYPKTLHWFFLEATFTWLTGFFLIGLLYYSGHQLGLTDPEPGALTHVQATLLALALYPISWLIYDVIWERKLLANPKVSALFSAVLISLLALVLCHFFSGRAAFIHLGAIFGTIMVLNVWVRILPAQRQMVNATKRGEVADFSLGKKAKRRSVHNSYLTFPVLFMMLSNHYAVVYGSSIRFWSLIGLVLLGLTARHLMILKNQSKPFAWMFAPLLASLIFVVWTTQVTSVSPMASLGAGSEPVSFQTIRNLTAKHCISCHQTKPTEPGVLVPPRGLTLTEPESFQKSAQQIKTMVVDAKIMPLGNKTQMTADERELFRRWIEQGAKTE